MIPNSVTELGFGAFYRCKSLTSIEIPDSVTEIGDWAFLDCASLKEIIVEEGNPNYCSRDGVLYSKDMSRLIAVLGGIASMSISESVTEIGTFAFWFCTRLVELHLRHKEPINLSFSSNSLDPSNISLFVPEGTVDVYRQDLFYGQFKEVVCEK